jgi:ferrous iron transport protein B
MNRLAAMGFTPGAEVTILTGLNQRAGNWPGKTIEKKTGTFSFEGLK